MPTTVGAQEEILHWLALCLVPGLGPRSSVPLIERFGSPQGVLRATRSELIAAGLKGSVAQSIASGCSFDDAIDQLRLMGDCGAELIPYLDARYPPLLRAIFDPPLALFARGRIEILHRPAIAIVGTRRPTEYGMAAANRLAAELAAAGLVVVSGMAHGIDTAAHTAALDCGGDTMAVFGCGLDHIYPAENRRLAESIAARGLLLSEYPLRTPPHPQNFPTRNRIISGLSIGVLIVEGAQYSGSAITARLAAEQGREVYAVPGNITSKASWCPNLLIKQGAQLVQSAEDILADLSPDIRRTIAGPPDKPSEPEQDLPSRLQTQFGPNAPIAAAALARLYPDSPTHMDTLLETLNGASSSELIAVLFELELMGLIRQLPGRNFVKVW